MHIYEKDLLPRLVDKRLVKKVVFFTRNFIDPNGFGISFQLLTLKAVAKTRFGNRIITSTFTILQVKIKRIHQHTCMGKKHPQGDFSLLLMKLQ